MQSVVRFSSFELRAAEGVLLHHGRALSLGSRALSVLQALVARSGELVTKDELLDAAWPGLVVEEANVHVAVSQLRKVLGKASIATVSGLGYRWALPLQAAEQPTPGWPGLPRPRTAFVGRHAELAEAASQLHGTALFTVVAMGGMGKTRLALQLAQAQQGRYADGVAWVELQPLHDGNAVPGAVARALALAPQGNATAAATTEAVTRHLQGRHLLLVLDNCEQVLDAVRALLQTLAPAAAGVTVLATSRQALELPGERVFALRPLQVPAAAPGGDTPGPGAAAEAASEAVQLFMQRVLADNPGFATDHHNAALVADICRQLDGIPLALELAAARMKMLSLQQLHGLLAQRFELLSRSGAGSGTARQQTLQDVLQWSHEHLAPAEQALAQAVAVCASGFDLDTAVALAALDDTAAAAQQAGAPLAGAQTAGAQTAGAQTAGAQPTAPPPTRSAVDVLDSLAQLAERALIHVTHGAEAARYGMLETVREYLLAQLARSGRLQAARALHLAHFHTVALQAEAAAGQAAEAARWAARLDSERDNLLAALAWCLQHGSVQQGLELVAALKNFWFASGRLEQGLHAAQQALQRVPEGAPTLLSARVQRLAAQLCLFMSRFDEGAAHSRQALAASQALRDEAGAASALCFAGRIAQKSDDTGSGEQLLLEGLRRARQVQALAVVGEALNALAFAAIERDDLAAAEAHFGEALVNSQQRGSALGSVIETLNLAWVCVTQAAARKARAAGAQGEDERARQLLLSVWHSLQHMPHRYVAQEFVDVCASLALNRGWFEEAALLHAASAAQRGAIQLPLTAKQAARRASEAAAARAALGEAAYDHAAAAGRSRSHEATLARVGGWLQEGPLPQGAGTAVAVGSAAGAAALAGALPDAVPVALAAGNHTPPPTAAGTRRKPRNAV